MLGIALTVSSLGAALFLAFGVFVPTSAEADYRGGYDRGVAYGPRGGGYGYNDGYGRGVAYGRRGGAVACGSRGVAARGPHGGGYGYNRAYYGGCHIAYIPYGWTWYRASSC